MTMSQDKRQTYNTLKEHKLAPKKKFGQNFLVHRQTAEAIVRAGNVKNTDIIVEVGVGLGALTNPLASVAQHVYGYEIDSGIVRLHETQGDLPNNVTLIHQDILSVDFAEIAEKCGGSLKILANLPYSISNVFIIKLIENSTLVDSATIMLQKEVADRLMAEPRSKAYGIPTVLLNSCARVKKLMTLKPSEFHPRPKIDSVVISIEFNKKSDNSLTGRTPEYNFALFRRIVRTTFNQRRKTILNTLSGANIFNDIAGGSKEMNKKFTLEVIEQAHLKPADRPETLTSHDFIQLANRIEQLLEKHSIKKI